MDTKTTCKDHTINNLGFPEMSARATTLLNKGYGQKRCDECKLWAIWYHKKSGIRLENVSDYKMK